MRIKIGTNVVLYSMLSDAGKVARRIRGHRAVEPPPEATAEPS